MSWFMASIYDWFMRDMERECGHAWRGELLRDLHGDVLEIGAGTGRNLDHYTAPSRLVLAEPDPHMAAKLRERLATAAPAYDVSLVSWPAEQLEAEDASFDAVVSTLVLCSVRDPERVLTEVKRVLRPGGKLLFLEHVASDKPSRLAWQRRIEPFWRPIAGNCHLARDTARSIEAAGFRFETLTHDSARKALPIVRATIRGAAFRA